MSEIQKKPSKKPNSNVSTINEKIETPQSDNKITEQEKRVAIMAARTVMSSFEGPIPSPEVLHEYEKIQSGFADRIIKMAEKEQDNSHAMNYTIANDIRQTTRRAQWFAFILGGIGLISSTYLAATGHDWVAGIIGSTSIGLIVLAFLGRDVNLLKIFNDNKDIEFPELPEKP